MRTVWRNVVSMTAVLIACSAVAAETCYFLQSSGCNTGTGFCQENQTVCDTGYGTTDTGCGRRGPLTTLATRKCYKLHGVVTAPCLGDTPSGVIPSGCRDGTVCCYVTSRAEITGAYGDMYTPVGDLCGCKEVIVTP